MKKKLAVLLVVLALVTTFAFAACEDFENPGDQLGGGVEGEVATAVDSSASDSVKEVIKGKSDLSSLVANTSSDNATAVASTAGVVEISKSGTYLFKGEYGGIKIAKKELELHFIFDGVTISCQNGVAVDGTEYKKTQLVITLIDGTTNTVANNGDDVNAIHIKGSLAINGKGTLNVTSQSKSALKASKEIQIVDATLNLTAKNHGITGASVIAANCKIGVTSAGKDGINAECDEATEFTTDDGFVSLSNVDYTCNVYGDGIQADTVVYVNGGNYNIKTTGNFVQKSSANMTEYGMTAADFKYIKSGNTFKRIASDETKRYGNNLYGLSQGCKGIKVGEIEYTDDDGNDRVVTDGDYLIAIDGGTFNITSTDDAIHANSGNVIIGGGAFTIATMDDGITADLLTKITGGSIVITESYEGIEGGYVEISGGTINLVSSDDGINAASDNRRIREHIIISGGDVTVDASGDGLDSNGSILISGGNVVVHGPTSGGDAGLDADRGIVVNGGTLFASSTLGMVETPATNSTQCVVSYAQKTAITVGSTIALKDKKGNVLIEMTVKKDKCQSIILSHPSLTMNSKYVIWIGGKKVETFTISSIITSIGASTQGSFGPPAPGNPAGPAPR